MMQDTRYRMPDTWYLMTDKDTNRILTSGIGYPASGIWQMTNDP